jgi:tyrosyl-tRNA synthetase
VPASRRRHDELDDLIGVLAETGLASSRGDARRTLDGRGYRANGVGLDTSSQLSDVALLHGRYLLLQRGRSTHHLVEVFT